MSQPEKDANCLNCTHRKTCVMATNKKHDENGKPPVDCYGYYRERTQEEWDNDPWFGTNK